MRAQGENSLPKEIIHMTRRVSLCPVRVCEVLQGSVKEKHRSTVRGKWQMFYHSHVMRQKPRIIHSEHVWALRATETLFLQPKRGGRIFLDSLMVKI